MTWNLHIHQDFQLPGPWILHPPHSHCDVPSGPLTLHPKLKPSQRSGMFCCLTAMKLPAALLSTPTLLLIHHASTKQASGFTEKLTVSLGYILIKMSHRSFPSDQIRSVTQLCLTLCDPMNRSMPGLPVQHHQLPEFTQTHVHRVSNAIQPSHPLSSPSPLAPNPSKHQSLFQWVNSSHEVAKVLEFQL